MSRHSGILSLSFLDVMTCGMGGMLLLFFILCILKGELELAEGAAQEITEAGRRTAPFVVVVAAEPGKLLWEGDGPGDWKLEGFDQHELGRGIGRNYAVLYIKRTPPQSSAVRIGPLRPGTRLTVQVFERGKRAFAAGPFLAAELGAVGNHLQVWPVVGEKRP